MHYSTAALIVQHVLHCSVILPSPKPAEHLRTQIPDDLPGIRGVSGKITFWQIISVSVYYYLHMRIILLQDFFEYVLN